MDKILDQFEDSAIGLSWLSRALEYKWLRNARCTSNMTEIDLLAKVEAIHYEID